MIGSPMTVRDAYQVVLDEVAQRHRSRLPALLHIEQALGRKLLTYFVSLLLPWRAVRVAIAFAVMHAFVTAPLRTPLQWSLIQETGLFFLVLLCDLAFLPPRVGGPARPRRTPAAALRNLVYTITTATRERRRISRAS